MKSSTDQRSPLARRSFLSRLGAGAAAFGTVFGARAAVVGAQTPAAAGAWKAARHPEDDWFEQPAAKHRFFLDTTSVHGFANAMLYVNNYMSANRSAYGLADADQSVIICVRHESAPFGFTDTMWAKYGAEMADHASFTDPKTKQPPVINVFQVREYSQLLGGRGVTLDANIKQGVKLAVCQLATRAMASAIAQKTGGKTDDVFKELSENLVPNARLVPAGIVAVSRAQERGYTFSYVA